MRNYVKTGKPRGRPRKIPLGTDTSGLETRLPPAGDARREELKARSDDLAEAAESGEVEQYGIDPAKFAVDNEIADHVNDLEVSHQRPERRYCWVWTGKNGYFVKQKSIQGWLVVQGEDQEAIELKESGTSVRRLGDVILMWIPVGKYDVIMARLEKMSMDRMRAVTANLQDMAKRWAGKGVVIHVTDDEMNSPVMQRALARAAARSVATEKVSGMIKQGTVPGLA